MELYWNLKSFIGTLGFCLVFLVSKAVFSDAAFADAIIRHAGVDARFTYYEIIKKPEGFKVRFLPLCRGSGRVPVYDKINNNEPMTPVELVLDCQGTVEKQRLYVYTKAIVALERIMPPLGRQQLAHKTYIAEIGARDLDGRQIFNFDVQSVSSRALDLQYMTMNLRLNRTMSVDPLPFFNKARRLGTNSLVISHAELAISREAAAALALDTIYRKGVLAQIEFTDNIRTGNVR